MDGFQYEGSVMDVIQYGDSVQAFQYEGLAMDSFRSEGSALVVCRHVDSVFLHEGSDSGEGTYQGGDSCSGHSWVTFPSPQVVSGAWLPAHRGCGVWETCLVWAAVHVGSDLVGEVSVLVAHQSDEVRQTEEVLLVKHVRQMVQGTATEHLPLDYLPMILKKYIRKIIQNFIDRGNLISRSLLFVFIGVITC